MSSRVRSQVHFSCVGSAAMDGIAPDETATANTAAAATNLTMNPPLISRKHDSLRTLEAKARPLSAEGDARPASRECDKQLVSGGFYSKFGSKAAGPLSAP